jgi:transposase
MDINILQEKLEKYEVARKKAIQRSLEYSKRTEYASQKKWRSTQSEEDLKERKKIANAKYNEKQRQKKRAIQEEKTKHCEECCGMGIVYVSDDLWEKCVCRGAITKKQQDYIKH